MKNLIILSLAIFSIGLFSCEKYLDVKPSNQVPDENIIFDKVSAQAAVRGVYRALEDLNYSSSFQSTILLSGGDVSSVNNAQTDLNVINYNLRSDIAFLQTYWTGFYNTINRANNVIAKLPSVGFPNTKADSTLKNQLLGEAYFLRAYSYFDLARVFGGVQIFLTPTRVFSDKSGVFRSSQDEVFNQVLADLNTAETLLPTTVVRNRATKYTVYALRARLNLYLKNYANAEADASSLLANSASYKLNTPFALPSGTTESILELTYFSNNLNPGYNLWIGNNRQLSPSLTLHNLLNSTVTGGSRKLLSTKNSTGLLIGGIFPSNTTPNSIIRTAEVYLIRAEARANLGNLTGALSDLNAVRLRSGIKASTASTQETLVKAIIDEKRVEFGLEPYRWFDLTRLGVSYTSANLGLNDPNKFIFPIPLNELTADPFLTQNPGY